VLRGTGHKTGRQSHPETGGAPPAAVPAALVESCTRVETELLPTLREDKETHIALRAHGDAFLTPLRHVIDKHPGYQVRRLIAQQANPRLRTHSRRTAIRTDNEPA